MADEGIRVAEATRPEDFIDAARLYTAAFGYGDENLRLNPLLLTALIANGGVAVAARDADGELIGFVYGFPGIDGAETYLYSQAAFVHPDYRGHGLGRRLKLVQRGYALDRGLATMRWAFDPLLSRNAYFNLAVLGASGRHYRPDFYGTPGSDRLIVEWDLDPDSPAREAVELPDGVADHARASAPGTVLRDGEEAYLTIATAQDSVALDAAAGGVARAAVRAGLAGLIDEGLEAISCLAIGENTSVYVLRPRIAP